MKTKKNITSQPVSIDKVSFQNIPLHILRLDKIHSIISGNKFFKLKYNIEAAINNQHDQVLTFGGAYSNHIAATAHAAQLAGIKAIGIIRGEKVSNPTLEFAQEAGMRLHFVDRTSYRQKEEVGFLKDLSNQYGGFYLIPEGGTNSLAIRGTAEIMNLIPDSYQQVTCCVGTGGTISGLVANAKQHQHINGFSALKGDWINDEVNQWVSKTNWSINTEYHFGGYAKWKPELIDFINEFKKQTAIPLDPIYTGKMLYGIVELIKKGALSPEHLLIIHSGGLQGIGGFNERFGNLIET